MGATAASNPFGSGDVPSSSGQPNTPTTNISPNPILRMSAALSKRRAVTGRRSKPVIGGHLSANRHHRGLGSGKSRPPLGRVKQLRKG